jgi:hypothetical protein
MSIDFQELRKQIITMGENARLREIRLQELRETARKLLESNAENIEGLRQKVERVVRSHDPTLRCAKPGNEVLNRAFPLPPHPDTATIISADGSQIYPDRHSEVIYSLINVGGVKMLKGSADSPSIRVSCQLLYDEDTGLDTITFTEATLALMRDLNERTMLGKLAERAEPPVITFTDGPMELWGARDPQLASQFQKSLGEYLEALNRLCLQGVITAGYVDRPMANLVVRLLEVASLPESELAEIKMRHPLHGVTDIFLFRALLGPGERSAVFEFQSQGAPYYQDDLALHFFYLNVGRPRRSSLARVEIPAWVADNPEMIDHLHAALVDQCRIMGARPYPYLLHRAHEVALVSMLEKEQVTQMITAELLKRGVAVGERSNKQFAKDQPGSKRYKR